MESAEKNKIKIKNQKYDSPWKEILDVFFPQFMEFFIPLSSDDIDWNKKIKFLDKEFQKITKDSVSGRRYADKLVEVRLKDNSKKWILIHVEVQGQKEINFSKRMFRYNYRIFDRYDIPVTSIAVLADDSPSWNPEAYKYGMWGSGMGLDYIKIKLLDYKEKWNYLEVSESPFAIVIMAHLKALETRTNESLRKKWKFELVKMLYEKGYSKKEVLNLFSFIDWVLTLPEELEEIFCDELTEFEKEKGMPYMTSIERLGRREGRQEGRRESLISTVHNARKQGLSVEMIARIVDLDVNLVNKIINNEAVDIPLHLLNKE